MWYSENHENWLKLYRNILVTVQFHFDMWTQKFKIATWLRTVANEVGLILCQYLLLDHWN